MSFVDELDKIFVGRRDVWAEGYPDKVNPTKYRYATRYEPLTTAELQAHVQGKHCVGIYPILEDNTVQWFAIDFDAPKVDGVVIEEPFPIAFEAAEQQAKAFEAAGLDVYVARSRSGTGAHVWGFLERPVDAAVVRQALAPLLTDHEIFDSRDRMFPVQDKLTESKPLGNLIAMPFFGEAARQGNSLFIDRTTREPIRAQEWVAGLVRNLPAVIQRLADKAPPRRTPAGATKVYQGRADGEMDYGPLVTGALKVISPYGCKFFRHCAQSRVGLPEPVWYAGIQISTHFQHGRDLAHILSMDDPRYDEGNVDAKFDQAMANPRIGCQWIHENYPALACEGCDNKAPHKLATQSILQLARGTRQEMHRAGSFAGDLARVKRVQKGTEVLGQPWGILGLDEYTRLRRSEFIAIGGAPSMGKTHLLVHAATTCARAVPMERPAMYTFVFSAETAERSLRTRLLAHIAEVDSRLLTGELKRKMTPQEWKQVDWAAEELSKMPLYLDYTSLSADDVLLQIETVLLRDRVPLSTPLVVFFDYLQFGAKMLGDTTDYDRISRLSTEFKFTAKILEHPVVVLSQLVRAAEGDDSPDMTWFKNSGRIESDIDLGIIMTGERMTGDWATRSLHIVKQREGVANVRMDFSLQQTYGFWRYVGMPEHDVSRAPLFDAGVPNAIGE